MLFLLGMDCGCFLTTVPPLRSIAKPTPNLLSLDQNWRQNSPTRSSASGHLTAFVPSRTNLVRKTAGLASGVHRIGQDQHAQLLSQPQLDAETGRIVQSSELHFKQFNVVSKKSFTTVLTLSGNHQNLERQ